jgi:hypothetical protein
MKLNKSLFILLGLITVSTSWAQSSSTTLNKDVASKFFELFKSESNKGVYINVREIIYKVNAGSKNNLLDTVSQMRVFDSKYLNESITASIKSGVISNGFEQGTYTINGQKSVMTATTTFPYINSIDFNSSNDEATFKQGKVDCGLSLAVTPYIYSKDSSMHLNIVVDYSQLTDIQKNKIADTDYYTELPNVHRVRYGYSIPINPTESIVYKLLADKDVTKYLIITATANQAF